MTSDSSTDNGDRSIWMRALYMILFAILYSIAEIVVVMAAVFQFFCVLLTGERNRRVLDLGRGLSLYIYEILRFETFDSERLPFPFDAWPQPGSDGAG